MKKNTNKDLHLITRVIPFRLYRENNLEKVSKIKLQNINNKKNENNDDYGNEVLCSAIIVLKENIIPTSDSDFFQLKSINTFGENNHLAYDQPFHSLPIVHLAIGTGFAISDNFVITAKHVIENNFKLFFSTDLATVAKKQLVFVFNYTDVNSNLFVKKEDIFYLDSVFKDSYNDKSNPSDFVIFKINDNQKIPNKYIGKLETSEEDFAKSKVYMAGYPYGLPLIVSLNAKIISKSYKDGYYRTDLDALNLNSGSPVFNQQKKIIGILHGNAGDFVPSDKSPNKQVFLVSNINNIDEGMLVLPINNIVKFLKNKK